MEWYGLWHGTILSSAWYDAWCGILLYVMALYDDMVWDYMVWYCIVGIVWDGMVAWYGVLW